MLIASGEESSDYDSSDDGGGGSLDGNQEGGKTGHQLKSLIRNVSGGCGGLGHALRRWSCQLPLARQTRAAGQGEPGAGAGAGAMAGSGAAPRWIPDDEKEACMLCERK